MKITSIAFVVMVTFSLPLIGYCDYPTMDRARELFDEMSMTADYVSMKSEAYSNFAEGLQCQTTPENAREMETFLLDAVTSINVTVSTNAVDDGTSAGLLRDRGGWFAAVARTFQNLPTNSANCTVVANYLGGVHGVDFPIDRLRVKASLLLYYSPDKEEMEAFRARRSALLAERNLQFRVRETNKAVDQYRKDLLSVCNVGVRGCRGIMDDAQFCTFTNQLATSSNASEAERQILFDSIPSPQGEGD